LAYRDCSLIGESTLTNETLHIRIISTEGVSHRENWFVRRMNIQNLSDEPAEVRVFFSHDLRIMETDIGDTSFFHPLMDGVIHYKGPCYFLFGGEADGRGMQQYACGLKGFGGFEGTWRDAEDGELGMNPIAQGSVDSTVRFDLNIESNAIGKLMYWIVASDDLEDLETSHGRLKAFGAEEVLADSDAHWRHWASSVRAQVAGLPSDIAQVCEHSLLIMRSHIDNGGAIIAATDSDIMQTNRANYCYMWPRDGALISSVLDSAGQHHLPRAFFEFCNGILPKNPPVLRQKYTADGKLGATWHPFIVDGKPSVPFQEDETALMILAMWQHHRASPDSAALQHHMDHFVLSAADYLVEYRDPLTHLPLHSYDLWEERLGIHTYTVATVVAGLEAAAFIADELSHTRAAAYRKAAKETKAALLKHLVDKKSGRFIRSILKSGPDLTIDASTLHVGLLGILPANDKHVVATASAVESALVVKGLGGVARYQGDYYFRRHDDLPGNPWIICTLWLAQHKLAVGDREGAFDLVRWVGERATTTCVLPEQVDAVTGEHLSVSPLTWSHAEFVKTCFMLSG
jgi:GH15 family glucan-1,4-alpha-glucosidase